MVRQYRPTVARCHGGDQELRQQNAEDPSDHFLQIALRSDGGRRSIEQHSSRVGRLPPDMRGDLSRSCRRIGACGSKDIDDLLRERRKCSLARRSFYFLTEVAIRWPVAPFDVTGWSTDGLLALSITVLPVKLNPAETSSGFADLEAPHLLPQF